MRPGNVGLDAWLKQKPWKCFFNFNNQNFDYIKETRPDRRYLRCLLGRLLTLQTDYSSCGHAEEYWTLINSCYDSWQDRSFPPPHTDAGTPTWTQISLCQQFSQRQFLWLRWFHFDSCPQCVLENIQNDRDCPKSLLQSLTLPLTFNTLPNGEQQREISDTH